MTTLDRPFLLDVTRLIARGWTRRLSTGIDRVCYAYLRHFGARSQAVVQHRGALRVLKRHHSDAMFDLLLGDDRHFRRKLIGLTPRAVAAGASRVHGDGAIYINVSHTDFDLPSHTRWTQRCGLRPTYMIHDLIPITSAEFCRPHAVRRHRGRVVNALTSAAGIIVNSAATAQDLRSFARTLHLPMPRTLAASLAGEPLDRPVAAPASSPDGAPYFVCVGTIEPRKNHLMLLTLWRKLVDRMGTAAPHLVIVGQWGTNSQPVRDLLRRSPDLRDHVTVLQRCDDGELSRWMAGARALLMPTLAEGFGLPMAEALQLGVPVIASDLPCFREIGQGIPTLLDPRDPAAWERLITEFAHDAPERRRQIGTMPAYRASTWDRHFSEVESWFDSLPPLPPSGTAPALVRPGRRAMPVAGEYA